MTTEQDLGALVAEKDIPQDVQYGLIKRRTERGMTPVQIARLMGLTTKDVKAIIKTNGWAVKRELYDDTKRGRPSIDPASPKGRVSEVRRLAKEGYVRKDIAETLGISQSHVNLLCRRYNIRTAGQKERVERMYGKGSTQEEIANQLGIPKFYIDKMIQKYDIKKGAKS